MTLCYIVWHYMQSIWRRCSCKRMVMCMWPWCPSAVDVWIGAGAEFPRHCNPHCFLLYHVLPCFYHYFTLYHVLQCFYDCFTLYNVLPCFYQAVFSSVPFMLHCDLIHHNYITVYTIAVLYCTVVQDRTVLFHILPIVPHCMNTIALWHASH